MTNFEEDKINNYSKIRSLYEVCKAPKIIFSRLIDD